jgi:hypothetical protein
MVPVWQDAPASAVLGGLARLAVREPVSAVAAMVEERKGGP